VSGVPYAPLLAHRTCEAASDQSIDTLMHLQEETCINVMLMSLSNSRQLDQYERSLHIEFEMRSKAMQRKLVMLREERLRRVGGGQPKSKTT
jgi:hypothetical protein